MPAYTFNGFLSLNLLTSCIASTITLSKGFKIAASNPAFNASTKNEKLICLLFGNPWEILLTPRTVFSPNFFTFSVHPK